MKFLTWQNPEQLFVAQELINKVKSKCCGIKDKLMAQTAMTVRMDNQQKAQFDKLCEQFGMSANTAINIFVKAVIRSKSIPFSIQAKNEEEDEVTAKAKAAFQYMCDTARENNIDMSLDEINEEIREVRRLRKERNGICSH